MAKTLAVIFGVVFLLIGLGGFVVNPLVGAHALFETDTTHNVIHLVLGAVLLVVGLLAGARAALWLKIIGAITLILGMLGLLGGDTLLGIAVNNGADTWLHFILGAVLLAAGFLTKGEAALPMIAATPPSTHL